MRQKEILKEFIESTNNLIKLSEHITISISDIKKDIECFKKFGISLLGKPIITIFNDFVQLYYLILSHHDNCLIYQDLIEDDFDLDHQFQIQLEGMILITEEFHNEYHSLKERFTRFHFDVSQSDILSKVQVG